MKSLLLLGDSIRAGYDRSVKRSLEGKANVIFPEESHSDPVHYYTPMATEAFTKQVLSCVAPALGIDEPIEYAEEMYVGKPVGR